MESSWACVRTPIPERSEWSIRGSLELGSLPEGDGDGDETGVELTQHSNVGGGPGGTTTTTTTGRHVITTDIPFTTTDFGSYSDEYGIEHHVRPAEFHALKNLVKDLSQQVH